MNIKLTRGRVALVAAALVTGIAGVSYAAIPAANGTISACKDAKGSLKVIDAEAGQVCGGNQQLLTWNQQGPAGPSGPSGPQGLQGPAGPPTPVNWVNVSANASSAGGITPQRVFEGVVRTGPGQYTLNFDRTLQLCTRWVSSAIGPRMFAVGHGGFNGTQLLVRAYDASGALVDTTFAVNFTCPS